MKPTSLLLIILAVALFYFFTSSQYSEVKTLQVSADEYTAVLDNVSRMIEARDRLLDNYQSLPKDQLARLDKALPDKVDTVGLAVDLDNIASRYGISINSVRVQNNSNAATVIDSPGINPSSNRSYDKVLVSFDFSSNYDNFVKFLADLEKSLRIMNVQSVGFSAAGDTTGGVYQHSVTVETYWLK